MATITVKLNGKSVSTTTNSYEMDVRRVDVTQEDLNKFYRRTGWLSNYSFMCGYMESAEGYTLQAEGGWAVKGEGIWENFERYTEAKKYFSQLVKDALRKRLAAN